ncbi:uncharacterized protein LOC134222025 [Armigeres subalbatus]|uniref:uncharacterized protein LOC134222025 n=1 Tax=Armigeres subalbatus TaxID=124917 RepID=UPI002ED382A6
MYMQHNENYFIPRGGDRRNIGGKIANKIGNLKQKRRRNDVREEAHLKKLKPDESGEDTVDEMSREAEEWLALNNSPWSTVLDKWNASFTSRKRLLSNRKSTVKIIKTYSHYKQAYGFQLIDADFRLLSLGQSYGLQTLATNRPALISYISKKALDLSAENLLKLLTSCSTSENTRHCALLLALHTVLPPIAAGARYKPTVCVAQEDTVVFATSLDEAKGKVENIYSGYEERNLPLVPKLMFIGSGVTQIDGPFYVYYGDICYELDSAARATDVLLKLSSVFGLPFSKLSKLVWQFLSCYVYRVSHRETYAAINRLTRFLDLYHK